MHKITTQLTHVLIHNLGNRGSVRLELLKSLLHTIFMVSVLNYYDGYHWRIVNQLFENSSFGFVRETFCLCFDAASSSVIGEFFDLDVLTYSLQV
jgi:hypothetical protein